MALTQRLKKRNRSDSAVTGSQLDEQQQAANVHNEIQEDVKDTLKDLKGKQKELEKRKDGRRFYTTRRFLFPLGLLLGILVGVVLIHPNDFSDFQTHLALLMDEFDITIPEFSPLEFPLMNFTRVEMEWQRLWKNIPEPWKLNNNGLEFTVGEKIAAKGLSAKYPVVLVPGIISTGLESWSTSLEYRPFFRKKLWGGFSMISQVTFNRDKWIAALMLDPVTGLDPPGVKVRAAEGIDAASSFIQGYWLWSKIVENLAVVGYDTNNLHLAPYDWRLSFYNLEERDGYFSKLRATIEGFVARENRKVVLSAHSMGSTYFLKWVESPLHGKGGPDWVENHIEAFITIAGTHLVRLAKAMSAFLSGEMKDTVQINPAGAYVLERFFSRKERQKLFRSWAGSASMWIKGGDDVWGNVTFAPDDRANATHSHGPLIAFRASSPALDGDSDLYNMTSGPAGTWILERTPTTFQKMLASNYSFGLERDVEKLKANNLDFTKWTNPLEIQLPNAPSMKIYCVYGHGKDTERSYWYTQQNYEYDEIQPDSPVALCAEDDPAHEGNCTSPRPPLDMPMYRATYIDAEYTDEAIDPPVINGVKMGEGDGTVSLLSLGAMCVEGWKRERWNPAGIKVTTVELPHNPVATIPRGGGTTSDHVDILGATGLNEIILQVATGAGDEVKDSFVSNIREYAKRVKWD
ncbi:phospholipid:diacylglycerol acyltransferase [Dichomitus squalens LYAD-421 SS1]|uniref:phospholipid:diacylglycerol acyltransferase n=1 Tax=Dichomitus squalens (strain LYAD-421) TaxID=732165 RepID=UPI0004413E3D|nr:phospholipid:diacylglycerol acyltransferase [Dichomitus squalens LYAD-421 SS1]EJF65205.1 phospholipid:diacylglycerol acyltransferase [Dichomitus squalens LYAD-421 SS1]